MRILILGAGATGGYLGGRLIEGGADVTFLVRDRRAAQLRDYGLVVLSGLGDIRRNVEFVNSTDIDSTYDLVILSCKAYDLASSIEAIRPAVSSGSAILPLLNGLAHLQKLDHEFGRDRVLGGLCHLSASLDASGHIKHLNQTNQLVLGPRFDGQQVYCDTLSEAFSRTSVEVRVSECILQDMWEKFVMLTTAAAMTSAMRANVGEVVATDSGTELMLECLDECRDVAASYGYPQSDAHYSDTRKLLTTPESRFTASMLRDIEQGAPTEADHILGHMLRLARDNRIATPLLRMAYCHLQAYRNRRLRSTQ